MKKNNILLYLSIAIFAGAGIYLLFFVGNTKEFDKTVEADRIHINERRDSDGNILYYPTYIYTVDGNEYECSSSSGSSMEPNENKKTVYYDSKDPSKCVSEYEKSSGILGGVICIAVAILITVISRKDFNIETPPVNNNEPRVITEADYKAQENIGKVLNTIDKVSLIIKRVILGIVIIVILLLLLFDTTLLKQTIKSKDYIETKATYVESMPNKDSEDFVDLIYSFEDKNGNTQRVTITIGNSTEYNNEIKLRYNENDPSDFYEEGTTLDRTGIIWFVVKVVLLILLIVLFFNKKWLGLINISIRKN